MKVDGKELQILNIQVLSEQIKKIQSFFQPCTIQFYNNVPEYVDNLIKRGVKRYHVNMYQDAIVKLRDAKEALICYNIINKENIKNITFKSIDFYIAKCYLEQGEYCKAKILLEACFDEYVSCGFFDIHSSFHVNSIREFSSIEDFPCAENAANFLAYIYWRLGEVYKKIREKEVIIKSNNATYLDRLSANLLLGAIYQFFYTYYTSKIDIEHNQQMHVGKHVGLEYLFKSIKCYNDAYELEQGPLDKDAYIVEQREVGVSCKRKLGTHNLQQCVAIIAHDPMTKKTALGHFDRFSLPQSITDNILSNFVYGTKINLYLVGARHYYNIVSMDNVRKILTEIIRVDKLWDIDIKGADILYKMDLKTGQKINIPSAIVFDPNTGILSHAIPTMYDGYYSSRFVKFLMFAEENQVIDGACPMTVTNFDNLQDVRFTFEERTALMSLFVKTINIQCYGQRAWSSRLNKCPYLKVAISVFPISFIISSLKRKNNASSYVKYSANDCEMYDLLNGSHIYEKSFLEVLLFFSEGVPIVKVVPQLFKFFSDHLKRKPSHANDQSEIDSKRNKLVTNSGLFINKKIALINEHVCIENALSLKNDKNVHNSINYIKSSNISEIFEQKTIVNKEIKEELSFYKSQTKGTLQFYNDTNCTRKVPLEHETCQNDNNEGGGSLLRESLQRSQKTSLNYNTLKTINDNMKFVCKNDANLSQDITSKTLVEQHTRNIELISISSCMCNTKVQNI
ncbi:hypothetical protein [Candidatus Neoehrlichia procyonis]|uniref:hypothetical protein n=1 Tax=Candidatus Neoehrlichia procyonis TaxID=467750 RepID=UPI0018DE37A1|nr:hypothetical protein [Candidatus Neoehrlichia lotoris]